MKSKYLGTVILLLFSIPGFSQSGSEHHDHIHTHNNEFAVANSWVYFISEKESSYGLHFHYIRMLRDSDFGLGLGLERIFDEHRHYSANVSLNYIVNDKWKFGIAPGISFEGKSAVKPALHLESAYEINLRGFHIGPMIEYAVDNEDSHVSIGIHIGLGF